MKIFRVRYTIQHNFETKGELIPLHGTQKSVTKIETKLKELHGDMVTIRKIELLGEVRKEFL